jgi:hypothetical protein
MTDNDPFFKFDLEESLFVEARIINGFIRIDLCHIGSGTPCTLFDESRLWPSFRYDIGRFNENGFIFIEPMFEADRDWKIEMPKYELWPKCLGELTKTLEIASVMLV